MSRLSSDLVPAPPLSHTVPSSVSSNPAAVVEWYRYWIMAYLVTSSSPVPLKTRRVGQRCTLICRELKRAAVGVVVRRGGASSGVVHVT
ncbi:hypothetical protein TNCV_1473691 [Trichonephila clavipes]|nr:hypothetical protein TNCV_1473691 [Trichonephila clavipes]